MSINFLKKKYMKTHILAYKNLTKQNVVWEVTYTQPIWKIFSEVDYNIKPHYLSPYAWLVSKIFFYETA